MNDYLRFNKSQQKKHYVYLTFCLAY